MIWFVCILAIMIEKEGSFDLGMIGYFVVYWTCDGWCCLPDYYSE
jgi:hypothetical protein